MITFSASQAELSMAAAVAGVAAAALAALEWSRPDLRYRAWRMGATVLAVAALALLGLHPAWHNQPGNPAKAAGETRAVLWTPGGSGSAGAATIPARDQIALPGATAAAEGAIVYPDTATWRRRFPEIGTVQVFGGGLEAGNLDALRGLRVLFQGAVTDEFQGPSICFVHYPSTLALGQPLIVTGEMAGLVAGSGFTLKLEAPDGSSVDTGTLAAAAGGQAGFTLHAAPPSAAGRFNWRLRLLPAAKPDGQAWETESLGIAVVKPALPRVLVLESSPHFDTADLRRWFARAGGQFIARTMVGQDRYRYASAAEQPAPEFPVLDAKLLTGFDLVLADPAALAALTSPERQALLTAVTETGLGVLALADEIPPPTASNLALFPWQLVAMTDATAQDGEHLERPAWIGQNKPIATPIPAAPVLLAAQPGQSELIRDGQGRTLAGASSRGRGQLALTLLHDSGRWLRGNDAAAFGEYWSFLFSRLARPTGGADGPARWTVGDGAPVFAGEPVTLVWSGPAPANATAQVKAASGTGQDGAALALAQDPAEPGQWRGTFWPRQSGWYRVSAASTTGEAALDFFVAGEGSWAGVAAERRRLGTERFAAESEAVRASVFPPMAIKGNAAIPAVCCFLLFLTGAGFLWTERRFSGA